MHADHTMKPSRSKTKRGFTLTEVAIVLGIIGLILGAIWVAASAVYNNMRVAQANTQLLQIAQGIRALYTTTASTSGLTVSNAVCTRSVPSDTIPTNAATPATCTNATYLNNPFPSGQTTILPTSDNYGFQIMMTGVSRANCDNLLMQAGGASRDPGLTLAEGAAAPLAAQATGTPLALAGGATPTAADAAVSNSFGGCSAIATTGAVTFVFSLK